MNNLVRAEGMKKAQAAVSVTVPVEPGRYYVIKADGRDVEGKANERALIAQVRFLNAAGQQLRGPYAGGSSTERLGPFVYLPTVSEGKPLQWSRNAICAPDKAASLQVRIRPWKVSDQFTLGEGVQVAEESTVALFSRELAVVPEAPLRLILELADRQPCAAAAVICVDYLDAVEGVVPGPYIGCSESARFGPYFYAPVVDAGAPRFAKGLQPPATAVRMRIRAHRWQGSDALGLSGEPEINSDLPKGFDGSAWNAVGMEGYETTVPVTASTQGLSRLQLRYYCDAPADSVAGYLYLDFLDASGVPLTDASDDNGTRARIALRGTGAKDQHHDQLVWRKEGAVAARLRVEPVGHASPLLVTRTFTCSPVELPSAVPDVSVDAGGRNELNVLSSGLWTGVLRFSALRVAAGTDPVPEVCIFYSDAKLETLPPDGSISDGDMASSRYAGNAAWIKPKIRPSGVKGVEILSAVVRVSPPIGTASCVIRVDNRLGKSPLLVSRCYHGSDELVEERLTAASGGELATIEKMSAFAGLRTLEALVAKFPDEPLVLSAALAACRRLGLVNLLRKVAGHALASAGSANAKLRLKARLAVAAIRETDPSWLPDPGAVAAVDRDRPASLANLRIAHLFKTTVPYENTGGAIRCRNIVRFQKQIGMEPIVISPLGYPARGGSGDPWEREEIDGIPHYRLNCVGSTELRSVPVTTQLDFTAVLTARLLAERGVDLIQAASGYRGYEQALWGMAVARAMGVPFVYEVRSYHEHAWREMADWLMDAELTQRRIVQENRCMHEADAVVTICETMKNGLIERGIAGEKIFVIPNSVDLEQFVPQEPEEALRKRLGLNARTIVGYISNVSAREGHHVLLRAVAVARAAGVDIDCLIVGDGPKLAELEGLAAVLGISEHVVFTGEVPHHLIPSYYALIDIFVVPRVADFASDFVTPMKPFEAMAMKKPVVISDRPALREVVEPDVRGLVFSAGSHADLAGKLIELEQNPELRDRLADAGHRWITESRSWETTIKTYLDVYRHALDSNARRV